MNKNNTPFKTKNNTEVLADEVTAKAPAELIIALLAISLCFGLPRTESAIKATYAKTQAAQIVAGMNLALRLI